MLIIVGSIFLFSLKTKLQDGVFYTEKRFNSSYSENSTYMECSRCVKHQTGVLIGKGTYKTHINIS